MSARKLDLADDLQQRLPEVGDALYAGWLDEPKARTLCEQTRDLVDDLAHEVCRIVLPEAPELPVGALIERIEQVATSLDPESAERRRRRAEARARVILSPNPSGTANLSFCDAPAPDGLASQARIDALAAAVRHLGVLTPIGVLRLQVGLRLLDGSTAGMDDRTIAAAARRRAPRPERPDDPDHAPDDGPDDGPRCRRRRPRHRAGRQRTRRPAARTTAEDEGPGDDGADNGGRDDSGPATTDLVPTVPAPRSPSEQGVLDLLDVPDVSRTRDAARPARHRAGPDPGRLRRGPAAAEHRAGARPAPRQRPRLRHRPRR